MSKPWGPHTRIVVIGSSGAGKSTLARRLSHILTIPQIDLDALNWEADWRQVSDQVFRERVRAAIERPGGWVVAGHYHNVRALTWANADAVIWLDYSFPVVFWRALKRTLMRSLKGEVLWNGNRESLYMAFFTKDSILLWLLQTFYRRRRQTPVLLSEFPQVQVFRFHKSRQAIELLRSLEGQK